MSFRSIIYDTVSSEMSTNNNGSDLIISKDDFESILGITTKLKSKLDKGYTFLFNGIEYHIKSSSLISVVNSTERKSADLSLFLSFRSNEDYVTCKASYCCYVQGQSRYVLKSLVNPTTLLTGSNHTPLIFEGITRGSYKEPLAMFKLPFNFILSLLKEFNFVPSDIMKKGISRGKIAVDNCQWAFYLPSDNKQRDLKTLEYLYLRMSSETDRRFLASYLGLSPHVDPSYPESCFMLRKVKKNGKGKTTSIMSIAFYDKQAELIEKGKTISKEIKKALESSIRVDITAHKPWLESLVGKAKKHIATFPEKNRKKYELFLKRDSIDAYSISRAMSVLRIYKNKEEWICGSFSKFLIEDVLIGTLKLDILLSRQNIEIIDSYSGNKRKMVELWKEGASETLIKTFSDKFGVSLKQAYAIRNSISLDNVSLDIPYKLWLELDTLDIVYGLSHKERESLFNSSDAKLKQTLINSRNTVKNSRLQLGKSLQKALELRAKPLALIKD